MVFQNGRTPDSSLTPRGIWAVPTESGYSVAPWDSEAGAIQVVRFKDAIHPTTTAYWFAYSAVERFENLENLDTSAVTDMSGMFRNCTSLTELDLSAFRTENVTSMREMFTQCPILTRLNLSSFQTGRVTDMSSMFANCFAMETLDLSSFDTSSVTNMASMFSFCLKLTTVIVTDFRTDNVTDSLYMFQRCAAIVGGKGTKISGKHIDAEYARADNPPDAPGYFTLKDGAAPEEYSVSFDANGGGGSMDSVTVTSGDNFTFPQNGFSAPAQKKFRIWAVGNVEYAPGSVIPVTGPVTVTAQWQDAPSSTSSGGCYVATAVYGSYDCPEVWTLRRFRDNVLAKTWYGRLFIRLYYAVSPTAVKLFGDCEWFQNFFRGRLDKMVDGLRADGFASTPYQDKDW